MTTQQDYMRFDYWNTNNECGQDLISSRGQAKSQQQIILEYFRTNPGLKATPFDIKEWLLPGTPITSVRRAMTNLTKDGYLEKTDTFYQGRLGKQNHAWQLRVKDPLQLKLNL